MAHPYEGRDAYAPRDAEPSYRPLFAVRKPTIVLGKPTLDQKVREALESLGLAPRERVPVRVPARPKR
ncbi:hypothetical protein J4439_05750 [Candidatus Woesearchaeota archaeon]|nr:hypothetical protein [Candidatus Woesearchaeota archaeon]